MSTERERLYKLTGDPAALQPRQVEGNVSPTSSENPRFSVSSLLEKAKPSKLHRLDVARMVREDPPPVPWIIDGLVVRGTLTILNGREGEGKSLLAMALAAGVALGENQAGMECHAGRVLIVDTENGRYETHRRVHALGLPDTVEVYEPADGQRFDLRADLGDLERLLAQHKPDLLILDSFRTLWSGEENDSGDVAKVLDPLRNLVRKHKAGTILLHHSGKGTGGSYRGSSAIGASAELGFTLAREEADEDPARRSLTCWKCRPAPKPPKAWLRLSVDRGRVLIDRAEASEEETQPTQPVVSELSTAILDVATEEPTSVAELARRVGRPPKDGSVRNALSALERDGHMHKAEKGWCKVQRCKPPRAVAPLHPSENGSGRNAQSDRLDDPANAEQAALCRCERPMPVADLEEDALRCGHCGRLGDMGTLEVVA